ncbi:MAG: plasmid partitioning protein RepB [Pseudomonadota bacterium]
MALDKNKTGIMAAITAAAEGAPADRAVRSLHRGTIGSVRAGVGGIHEVDAALILPWGPQDRMALTAVNSDAPEASVQDLAESIGENGQQVPVLLRPAPAHDGHFEVIYGRRRILACRQLGVPVKALIRVLDETQALMAKGLENASRTDLSYYERARFAQAILEQGHSRAEACQALAISKQTLSQLERITRLVPVRLGDAIGAAPGAGRPKWMALVAALEGKQTTDRQALKVIERRGADTPSDARLDAILADARKRGTRARSASAASPVQGVTVKSGRSSVTVTVQRTGKHKAFADWFDGHLDDLLRDALARFERENCEGYGQLTAVNCQQ